MSITAKSPWIKDARRKIGRQLKVLNESLFHGRGVIHERFTYNPPIICFTREQYSFTLNVYPHNGSQEEVWIEVIIYDRKMIDKKLAIADIQSLGKDIQSFLNQPVSV